MSASTASLIVVVAISPLLACGGEPGALANSTLRREMSLLIRADATKQLKTESIEEEPGNADASLIILDRIIVREDRLPQFEAPRENQLAKILRTGTIREHVGKKTTVRLWTSGDAGLVVSFKK